MGSTVEGCGGETDTNGTTGAGATAGTGGAAGTAGTSGTAGTAGTSGTSGTGGSAGTGAGGTGAAGAGGSGAGGTGAGGTGAGGTGAGGAGGSAGSGGLAGSAGSGGDIDGGVDGGGAGGTGAVGGTAGTGGSSGAGGSAGAVDDAGIPDALPDFTDAEVAPTGTVDGIPAPLDGVYVDKGPADVTSGFRALIAFPMRDQSGLETLLNEIYDPMSPQFQQYLSYDDWMTTYGPLEYDVQLVRLWLESVGLTVARTAKNRLLVEFTGTVQQFNDAFQTQLHLFERDNPQVGNPPIDVYGTLGSLTVPKFVADRISSVLTADVPADPGPLPGEAGSIVNSPPSPIGQGLTVTQIKKAYGVDTLHDAGFTGQGITLGVVAGATFKFKDLQSFWQSLGVTRNDPIVVETMEPVATRYTETTIDVEWSGALAPDANLVVYEGPDSRNTSMVYTFNEAIGRNEASVLTDSFAHREDSEPTAVRLQYNASALMAAAMGITVIAASGDSGAPDTPSVSPWVVAAGGTNLSATQSGNVISEGAWSGSGSGLSTTMAQPIWQLGVVPNAGGKRAVVDIAVNAGFASGGYWVYYLQNWTRYGGTSFASPVFAGMVASISSKRASLGKPRLGCLSPALYTDANVQAAFRDITSGGTASFAAGPGWDFPTGWGAPKVAVLADALP